MFANIHTRKSKRGFALIVVLSALVILTSLFAITSNRTLTHLKLTNTNGLMGESQHLTREILKHVLNSDLAETPEFDLSIGTQVIKVTLVDVGGLIDLNTANPELLEILAMRMALSSHSLSSFRTWRRTPYRLLRVSDFLRLTGAGPEHYAWLLRVATVHSGRPGIAPEQAPDAVLELVTGSSAPRDHLVQSVPEAFQSPSSGVNFNVLAQIGNAPAPALLGTVHLPGKAKQNKLLWMH